MAAVSLTILGKNCEPLFIKEFSSENGPTELEATEEELFGFHVSGSQAHDRRGNDDNNHHHGRRFGKDCSLRQQFILHAALDRFEQLSGPPPGYGWRAPGVAGSDAMFVGLLTPVEDMKVYGTQQEFFFFVLSLPCSRSLTCHRYISEVHRVYDNYTDSIHSYCGGPCVNNDRYQPKAHRRSHQTGVCEVTSTVRGVHAESILEPYGTHHFSSIRSQGRRMCFCLQSHHKTIVWFSPDLDVLAVLDMPFMV